MLDMTTWNRGSVIFSILWAELGVALVTSFGTAFWVPCLIAFAFMPVAIAAGAASGHVRITKLKEA